MRNPKTHNRKGNILNLKHAWAKMGKTIIISLGLVVVLALTLSCAKVEAEQIEGILQNVDTVKGEITILTKDGQTITLDIATDASVESQGAPSTLDSLEIGASIQIEVSEDNQVAQSITGVYDEKETETTVSTEKTDDGDTSESGSSTSDTEGTDGKKIDEQTSSDDGEETQGSSGSSEDEPTDGDKPSIEPGVDQEGNATPDGDVDIDGDGKITIVDVVGGMEAERERLAEQIRVRTAAGEVDAEWVREVEAERERLAKEIQRALSDDTYIVVIDGRWLIIDIDPIVPPADGDDPPENGGGDDHGDDHGDDGGDDHGDDHPDDGDDHPDDGDDHPDDGDDGHSDDDGGHSDDGDDHSD